MATDTTIQDAVREVLADAPEVVAIDGRMVTVWGLFPEQGFKQAVPIVVVDRPSMRSRDGYDSKHDAEEWEVGVWFADSFKPSEEGRRAAEGRLEALRRGVERALQQSPYLGLVALDVLPGSWRLGPLVAPFEAVGNNLVRARAALQVYVLSRKG